MPSSSLSSRFNGLRRMETWVFRYIPSLYFDNCHTTCICTSVNWWVGNEIWSHQTQTTQEISLSRQSSIQRLVFSLKKNAQMTLRHWKLQTTGTLLYVAMNIGWWPIHHGHCQFGFCWHCSWRWRLGQCWQGQQHRQQRQQQRQRWWCMVLSNASATPTAVRGTMVLQGCHVVKIGSPIKMKPMTLVFKRSARMGMILQIGVSYCAITKLLSPDTWGLSICLMMAVCYETQRVCLVLTKIQAHTADYVGLVRMYRKQRRLERQRETQLYVLTLNFFSVLVLGFHFKCSEGIRIEAWAFHVLSNSIFMHTACPIKQTINHVIAE